MSLSVSFAYTPDVGLTSSDDGRDTIVLREPLTGDSKKYSPTELLLMAMGGCSTSDVLLIITKMHRKIESLKVTVEGERFDEEPRLVKRALFHYNMDTDASEENVLKAINLSLEKYCSVTLLARKGGVDVTYSLTLNGKLVRENTVPKLD